MLFEIRVIYLFFHVLDAVFLSQVKEALGLPAIPVPAAPVAGQSCPPIPVPVASASASAAPPILLVVDRIHFSGFQHHVRVFILCFALPVVQDRHVDPVQALSTDNFVYFQCTVFGYSVVTPMIPDSALV